MDIKPIESYEKPKYKSFELKTGLKLSAGIAATAMLMGMLSGCEAIEHLSGILPKPAPPPQIEVLAGDIAMPFYTPAPTLDVYDGELAAPSYELPDDPALCTDADSPDAG